MRPVLIVFDGYHGQTEKIANTLAAMLRATGHDAHVTEPTHLAALDLGRFDGIIIGGAIQLGRVSQRLLEFVRTHPQVLSAVPTGFFCVCMAAAREDADSMREAESYLARFAEETGLHATLANAFAGALRYTRHEFTDWLAVLKFARRFANELEARQPIAAE